MWSLVKAIGTTSTRVSPRSPRRRIDPLGARAEPAHRSHLRLVGQQISVRQGQSLQDGLHAGADLLGVRVAAIHDVERERMGAEEQQHPVPLLRRELLQSLPDGLRHGRDEPGVHRPAVDHAPAERVLQPGAAPRRARAR